MIDASGMHALKEFINTCKKKNITLYLSEIKEPSKRDLKAFGLLDAIGEKHIFHTLKEALSHVF